MSKSDHRHVPDARESEAEQTEREDDLEDGDTRPDPEDDPITRREELELDLMEKDESEAGEHIRLYDDE